MDVLVVDDMVSINYVSYIYILYMYIYVYMYVCICIYINIFTYICMCIYLFPKNILVLVDPESKDCVKSSLL